MLDVPRCAALALTLRTNKHIAVYKHSLRLYRPHCSSVDNGSRGANQCRLEKRILKKAKRVFEKGDANNTMSKNRNVALCKGLLSGKVCM